MHFCALLIGPKANSRAAARALEQARLEYGWDNVITGGRYQCRLVDVTGRRASTMRLRDFDIEASAALENADVERHLQEIDTFPERERATFLEAYGLKVGEGMAEYRQRSGAWAPTFVLWAGAVVIQKGRQEEHAAWAERVRGILAAAAVETGDTWLTLVDVHMPRGDS